MRRIFRQCGSTALQIKSFAIRYHFLFADAPPTSLPKFLPAEGGEGDAP